MEGDKRQLSPRPPPRSHTMQHDGKIPGPFDGKLVNNTNRVYDLGPKHFASCTLSTYWGANIMRLLNQHSFAIAWLCDPSDASL
eukprot:5772213-Pleurochrysis_carterae.AAC.1